MRIPDVGDLPFSTALNTVAADAKQASRAWCPLGHLTGSAEPVSPGVPQVAVHGNTLHAGGQEPVAQVIGLCNATFNDNRCRWTPARRTDPVVRIDVAGAPIVSANHVEGQAVDAPPAILLAVGAGGSTPHATVLGNMASGFVELNGGTLPAPWADLNINA